MLPFLSFKKHREVSRLLEASPRPLFLKDNHRSHHQYHHHSEFQQNTPRVSGQGLNSSESKTMMTFIEREDHVDGGYYQKADIDQVQPVDSSSPTDSSSSLVFSDDSRDTASSRSSVPSPRSPLCSDVSTAGQLTEWQSNNCDSTKCEPVPLEQRQNPRRTSISSDRQPPPSLVRQSERKECFVACLVSFATQFVEAIWPLAACTPRTDTSFHGRGVLSLHCFITETLRRSRTSYSTLQVALFYLVLIKEFVPKVNFTMEQPKGNDEFRAMQCGRRMFLTALILASKYLQDRNYSTRAWSKISGLRAQEIHLNEMDYCKKINWSLHIAKEKFDRWSYTVLRLSSPMNGPRSETLAQAIGWQKVLSKLNCGLTETFPTREDFMSCQSLSSLLPTNFVFGDSSPERRSNDTTSKEHVMTPVKNIETAPPQTCFISEPPQPRIDNLPTPQSTPHPNTFTNFSAVSATPSMCAAMSQVRNQGLIRVTRDQCPPPQVCAPRWTESRSSSLSRMTSAAVSPSESIISEAPSLVQSRGSRSSSISSSISSVSAASLPPRLGRHAPRTAALSREHTLPASRASDLACQKILSDLDQCTSSPESWERQSAGTSSPAVERVTVWSQVPNAYQMKNVRPQDWEAAEALCKLPSQVPVHSALPSPQKQMPSLSRSISLADYRDQLTPKASYGAGWRSENVSPSNSHKRTHSKTNDVLQDQVREQLRRTIWSTDMPDRTVKVPSSKILTRSPTQTFGAKQFPVPTKGSDGHKRHCAYQVSAAERAAKMLLNDRMRGGPIR